MGHLSWDKPKRKVDHLQWDGGSTIYDKSEPGLLFTDGLKWKNGTAIHRWREYCLKWKLYNIILIAYKKNIQYSTNRSRIESAVSFSILCVLRTAPFSVFVGTAGDRSHPNKWSFNNNSK